MLHDWPDGDALRILRRAREALDPGGRIYVLEMLLSDDSPAGGLLDLNRLVMTGGRERTLRCWQRLFNDAAVELVKVCRCPE